MALRFLSRTLEVSQQHTYTHTHTKQASKHTETSESLESKASQGYTVRSHLRKKEREESGRQEGRKGTRACVLLLSSALELLLIRQRFFLTAQGHPYSTLNY